MKCSCVEEVMNERKFKLIDRQIVNSNFIIKFERDGQSYNPGQNIWQKHENQANLRQDRETLCQLFGKL